MLERNNGGHTETICKCQNCLGYYVNQGGGQKSGSSPAVHIPEVGGPATGYCSTRCQYEAYGWSLDDIKKWYSDLGMDYDKIFYPGYLSPSRMPPAYVDLAHIGLLQKRVAKNMEGGEAQCRKKDEEIKCSTLEIWDFLKE